MQRYGCDNEPSGRMSGTIRKENLPMTLPDKDEKKTQTGRGRGREGEGGGRVEVGLPHTNAALDDHHCPRQHPPGTQHNTTQHNTTQHNTTQHNTQQ